MKETKTVTTDTALTGAADAYCIGFQLSASGYAVGLTTHGTRAIDMFIANPNTGKSITIQTRTIREAPQQNRTGSWWHW